MGSLVRLRARDGGVVLALSLVCAWSGAGLLGCARRGDARLLDLTGAGPSVLERGDHLRVSGSGFPAGHAALVELEGKIRVPARGATAVHVVLRGQALSSDRVEASLDEAAALALPVHGSFDGSLTLRFTASRGDTDVVGRLSQVHLDWVGALPPAQEQLLRTRAQATLAQLGIAQLEADGARAGLSVAQLAADGVAANAGLQVGDVIESVDGLAVHAPMDLAPAPGARNLTLQVSRAGRVLSLPLGLGGAASSSALVGARQSALVLLSVLCVLCGLFLGPFTSPSTWLARFVSRYRMLTEPPALLGATFVSRPGDSPTLARLRGLAAPLSCSGVAFALGLLGAAEHLQLDAASALLPYVVLLLLSQARAPRRMFQLTVQLLVLAVVVACVMASDGTRSLASLVSRQGAYPWAWNAFGRPQLSLGCVLFVVHAARLLHGLRTHAPAASAGSAPSSSSWASAVDLSGRLLLALSTASMFFGGWNVPPGIESAAGRLLLAGAAFASKTWLAAWLLGIVGELELGVRRRAWVSVCAVLATCGATVAWLAWPGALGFEALFGPALFAGTVAAVLIACVQVQRAPASLGQAPTVPTWLV